MTTDELIADHPRRSCRTNRTFRPAIAQRLAERMGTEELTPREFDVLEQIVHGKSNKEIAAELEISEATVKTHINSLLGKLGVTDRTQAATAAIQRGIVPRIAAESRRTDPRTDASVSLRVLCLCSCSARRRPRKPPGARPPTRSWLRLPACPRPGREGAHRDRNAHRLGIVSSRGPLIAGVVLITAGYSADGKYSHYLIVQAPVRIGGICSSPANMSSAGSRSRRRRSACTSMTPPPAPWWAPPRHIASPVPAASRACTSGRPPISNHPDRPLCFELRTP